MGIKLPSLQFVELHPSILPRRQIASVAPILFATLFLGCIAARLNRFAAFLRALSWSCRTVALGIPFPLRGWQRQQLAKNDPRIQDGEFSRGSRNSAASSKVSASSILARAIAK